MTSRREFVKFGVAGSFVGVAGCINPEEPSDNETEPNGNESEPDDNTGDNTDENTDENTDDNTGEDTEDDTAEEGGNEDDTREPDDGTDDQDTETGLTTITLNNEGFSAWVVEEVEDGNNEDIERQVSNPEIELSEGTRYRFVNNGGSAHPLGFRDADGNVLLSQSGNGEFEDSTSVNWNDEGGDVEFTLTSELADRMNEYYCTVHAQMVGDVVVV